MLEKIRDLITIVCLKCFFIEKRIHNKHICYFIFMLNCERPRVIIKKQVFSAYNN